MRRGGDHATTAAETAEESEAIRGAPRRREVSRRAEHLLRVGHGASPREQTKKRERRILSVFFVCRGRAETERGRWGVTYTKKARQSPNGRAVPRVFRKVKLVEYYPRINFGQVVILDGGNCRYVDNGYLRGSSEASAIGHIRHGHTVTYSYRGIFDVVHFSVFP